MINPADDFGGFFSQGVRPYISRSNPENIMLVNNCVIMVGSRLLRYYMSDTSSAVRRRSSRLHWWRDTSPDFYELEQNGKSTWYVDRLPNHNAEGMRLPDFYTIEGSVGEVFGVSASITIDRFGNEYFSAGPWAGGSLGIPAAHSEGYVNGENNYKLVTENELIKQFMFGVSVYGGVSVVAGAYRFYTVPSFRSIDVFTFTPSASATLVGATNTFWPFLKDEWLSWNWIISIQETFGVGPEDLINDSYNNKKMPYPLP